LAYVFELMSNELRGTKPNSEKNSGRNRRKFHHFRRIRNESALKSRFCQPGRERPRWIGRKPGCARPKRPRTKTLPKAMTDLMPRSVFCFQPLLRDTINNEHHAP
jgi:hypothetical protein